MKKNNFALFIDRDGVTIHMVKYDYGWDSAQKLEDVRLEEGVENVIGWANKRGIPVVEISNQPGVAKGKMSQEVSDAIETTTHELLAEKGVGVDKVYICPHLDGECDCRKPKPGLLLQATKELDIDLKQSVFLGDKGSDVEVGKLVGCKTIIFLHDEDLPEKIEEAKKAGADYKVRSMKEVLIILKKVFAK